MGRGTVAAGLPQPETVAAAEQAREKPFIKGGFDMSALPLERIFKGGKNQQRKIQRRIEAQIREKRPDLSGEDLERVVSDAMANVSIGDLSRFNVTRDKFSKAFLSTLEEESLIRGKFLAQPETIRQLADIGEEATLDGEALFDFERTFVGAQEGLPGTPGPGQTTLTQQLETNLEEDPNRQTFDQLAELSRQQIALGLGLQVGDPTALQDPLAQDFTRLFNETFGSQQATRSGNRLFSGEQQFAHSIGSRVAAQQFGETLVNQGLQGLQQADPFASPIGFLAQNQLAQQQSLFNRLTQLGRKARTEAIRAATPSDAEKAGAFTLGAFSEGTDFASLFINNKKG